MTDWREERQKGISDFEENKSKLVDNSSPEIVSRAKSCGMTTEQYLSQWVYGGLAPDARVAVPGEPSVNFPTI